MAATLIQGNSEKVDKALWGDRTRLLEQFRHKKNGPNGEPLRPR